MTGLGGDLEEDETVGLEGGSGSREAEVLTGRAGSLLGLSLSDLLAGTPEGSLGFLGAMVAEGGGEPQQDCEAS